MIWIFLISTLPYLVLVFFAAGYLAAIRPCKPSSRHDTVKLSVIIACKNEEEQLPALLNDLSLQDYNPDNYEVIVVDDHSSDATSEIAASFQAANIRVVANNGCGKKMAIRTGVSVSSGELIITTDADCRAGSKWLSTIASFFSENHPDMIIGPVSFMDEKGFLNKFAGLEFLALQGITAGTARAGSPIMCNGANLAFTPKAYTDNKDKLRDELGSGDDIFLLQALKKGKKYKILWLESDAALVTTRAPGTVMALIAQRTRWLSKAKSYSDPLTISSGIVTFVTIFGLLTMFILSFAGSSSLLLFAAALGVKSLPDLLLTTLSAVRRKKLSLLFWFIPVQLLYPFYVIVVSFCSLAWKQQWK